MYTEENKISHCPRAKSRAAHHQNLKHWRHTAASCQPTFNELRPPRGQPGQACDPGTFTLLSHACSASLTCRVWTSPKSLSQLGKVQKSIQARQRCAGSDVGVQKSILAAQHTKALMSDNNPSATAEPALPPKKPCPKLRYVSYGAEKESPFLPAIRQLISNDLSEPYSIYVYRYFLYQWGQLCFMVSLRSRAKIDTW